MSEPGSPGVDRLLEPSYLADLDSIGMDGLRAKRQECEGREVGLSYLRRVVQGRLDILRCEEGRRRAGGDASDVTSLVEQLPEILSDRVHSPGPGRLAPVIAPSELAGDGVARLEAIAPAARTVRLPEVPDDELAGMIGGLDELQADVSRVRRELHRIIDRIHEELVWRYQRGADIDALLQ